MRTFHTAIVIWLTSRLLLSILGVALGAITAEGIVRAVDLFSEGDESLDALQLIPQNDPTKINFLVLGESSAGGGHYYPKASPGALAEAYLREALPRFSFEQNLIFWGGATLEGVIQNLKEREAIARPTVIAVIVGHNNFLASFGAQGGCEGGYNSLFDHLISRSRLASFLSKRFELRRLGDKPDGFQRALFDVPIACPMRWQQIMTDFRASVRTIQRFARRNRIPLVFFLAAGNEADAPPNRSIYSGPTSLQIQFESLYRWGRHLFAHGELAAAIRCFEEAAVIDDRYAANRFWLGRARLLLGDLSRAREDLLVAKDRDGFPWRSLTVQQQMIEKLASDRSFTFVSVKDALTSHYPKSAHGYDLFYDTHHGTIAVSNLIGFMIAAHVMEILTPNRVHDLKLWSSEEAAQKVGFNKTDLINLLFHSTKWFDGVSYVSFEREPALRTMIDYMRAHSLLSGIPIPESFGDLYSETCRRCDEALATYKTPPNRELKTASCPGILSQHIDAQPALNTINCCATGAATQSLEKLVTYYPWLNLVSNPEKSYPCLDLAQASVAEVKLSPWGMKCDIGLNGDALTIEGKPITKRAITTHAGSSIRYLIPNINLKLSVAAAIPDYVTGKGGATVRLTVSSGRQILATSKVIKQGSPDSLTVDLTHLREFSIDIDDAGDGLYCDNVVITDITLIPQ